jgi:hypothetical protein
MTKLNHHALESSQNKVTSNQIENILITNYNSIENFPTNTAIAEITGLIVSAPSEYSFFDYDKIKMSNLPQHLKRMTKSLNEPKNSEINIQKQNSSIQTQIVLSAAIPKSSQGSNAEKTAATSKIRRMKKTAAPIDFMCVLDPTLNFRKHFKRTRRAICLSDRVIEERALKDQVLSEETITDFKGRQFFKPFEKDIKAVKSAEDMDEDEIENLLFEPTQKTSIQSKKKAEHVEKYDAFDCNHELPFQTQTNEPQIIQIAYEFDNQAEQNENLMSDNDTSKIYEETQIESNLIFNEENLLPAPVQVKSLEIQYAKYAKNINVRHLKQVIWNLLLETQDDEGV